ncbi:MAG: hypothetical protein KDC43_01750, partial [Saprospiraceae bacterium]|nr:hypothetical protein [Saprospiraceae bacterium]
ERLMGFYPISDSTRVKGFQFETTLLATPYRNRAILAKNASVAAAQLEDYEQYIKQLSAPVAV